MNNRLLTNKQLQRRRLGDDKILLKNPVHQTELEVPVGIEEVLSFFQTPATLAEFYEAYEGVEPEVIQTLQDHWFLLDEQDVPLLGEGFLLKPPTPIGAFIQPHEIQRIETKDAFVVVGAPIDLASTGALHGPWEIRNTFPWRSDDGLLAILDLEARVRCSLESLHLFDIGNVVLNLGESIETFGQRLLRALSPIVKRGLIPITLGGDHSVSWFPLQLLLEKHPAMSVIHFDAHHDLYVAAGPGLNHANPFLFALQKPSLKSLFQIGLRTLEFVREGKKANVDNRIQYISAKELRRKNPEEVFQNIPRDLPCYVSFDVDCMSPGLVKETGSRVLGGLEYYQGLELIEYAAKHFRIVGADFVEVGKSAQGDNTAAQICARYLAALVLSKTKQEPLDSYLLAT